MYFEYFFLKIIFKFQDMASKNCVGVKIKKRSLLIYRDYDQFCSIKSALLV